MKVLVIKLSALGDFVLACGPFKAIRDHHRDARVTLLTTAPYLGLARASGYFDEVWIDQRPKLMEVGKWLGLAARLRGAGFDRVYDLQRTDRTNAYFRLLGWRRPVEWCGIAAGCSHRYTDPRQHHIHTIERQKEQLAIAGVHDVPATDLSWARADLGRLDLPGRFALLVAGSSRHRPEKRWPAERFAELAAHLAARGSAPVLIGAGAERRVLARIAELCPAAVDLCDRTGFEDIVELSRRALVAVGNDTGPMHLVAAAGCAALVLFSGASRPELTAPVGPRVEVLRPTSLAELSTAEVAGALARLRPDL